MSAGISVARTLKNIRMRMYALEFKMARWTIHSLNRNEGPIQGHSSNAESSPRGERIQKSTA